MSPWPRKELRVVMCADHVTLVPVQRKVTLRGLGRIIHDPMVSSFQCADGAQPWRSALRELETVLPTVAKGRLAATLVLSNHFLRYAVVPWRAGLSDGREDLSYARHWFTQVYGQATLQWEIRLSHESSSMTRLASAVDAELLDGLRSVFDTAGIALKSIQPHLMAAFNSARRHLRQRSAWLALLEPGHVCLALVREGQWSRVRSLRTDNTWREELPAMLEREEFLADEPGVPKDVYLGHLEAGDPMLPELDGWHFHALNPAPAGASASAEGGHFAIAAAG